MRRNINKHGLPAFNKFLADLQIGGTPDEVVENIIVELESGAGPYADARLPAEMRRDLETRKAAR